MTKPSTPRFCAELASASSRASIIMSGDVDAYGIEQLFETAQRYARRVNVQLEGGEFESTCRMLERRLARLANRGIEVTLARA